MFFTVLATDSADESRTSTQNVTFTITNSDEHPTDMTVTPINASFSEKKDKTGGIDLARVRFDDPDNPAPSGQNNRIEIEQVLAPVPRRLDKDDFGIRRADNGDLIIFLRENADTTISEDKTYTIHFYSVTSGHGAPFAVKRSFQFTLENVDHDPAIARTDSKDFSIEARQYQLTDTGLRFRVTDADGDISPIKRTVSDPRFILIRSDQNPDSQEWKLYIKLYSSFTAGETIDLTITAHDERGATATETVSFTVGGGAQPNAQPTAPPNAKPTAVGVERYVDGVNEGDSIANDFVLARITVQDDGQGSVTLTLSGANSGLFEHREVEGLPGVYDLFLRSGVTLDQSMVGDLSVTINATGDGTGTNPDPVTFTLPVRNVEHAPAIVRSGTLTGIRETTDSVAADTGLRFTVTDADGNFTDPPTVRDSGSVTDPRFELRRSGQEWQLWLKGGKTFLPNEAIILTITATDQNGDTDTHRVNLQVAETSSQAPADPPLEPATLGDDLNLFVRIPASCRM